MTVDVQSFIRQKNWNYKQAGNEFQIEVCPSCGDAGYHLYINASSGLWKCHKCGEGGSLFKLGFRNGEANLHPFSSDNNTPPPRDLAGRIDKAHARLLKDPEALAYLQNERGFTLDTIKHFKLGLETESGKKWITIPHFSKVSPVNIKFRSLPPAEKEFKRVPGGSSILFNTEVLNAEEIILVEGELDCISLWQAGFHNAVGITCGAGSFRPEWVKQLEKIKRIYLCYDSDRPGQEGASKLARRLGYERCRNIILPVKDANDFFKAKYSPDDFRQLMKDAKPFKPGNLLTLSEAVSLASKVDDTRGLQTEWQDVNQLTGKFKPGDLIVLSAKPKTGKTTFGLNFALHNCMNHDHPVLFYCLEMTPTRLIRKMASRLYRKRDEELAPQDFQNLTKELPENQFIFGTNSRNLDLESVMETIRAAVRLYGIELVVFDHLHFLVRSLGQQTQEVGNAVRSFKLLAEELEIPIILVAQPRKGNDENVIGLDDLRDSSLVGADADQVIVLHRKKKVSSFDNAGLTESLSPETLVRVEASRYQPGGDTLLYFDGAYSLFRPMEKNPDFKPKEGDQKNFLRVV